MALEHSQAGLFGKIFDSFCNASAFSSRSVDRAKTGVNFRPVRPAMNDREISRFLSVARQFSLRSVVGTSMADTV
jgi:hypothetical protein